MLGAGSQTIRLPVFWGSDLSLGSIINEAAIASIPAAMRGLNHIQDIAIVVSDILIDTAMLKATRDIYTRCRTIGIYDTTK